MVTASSRLFRSLRLLHNRKLAVLVYALPASHREENNRPGAPYLRTPGRGGGRNAAPFKDLRPQGSSGGRALPASTTCIGGEADEAFSLPLVFVSYLPMQCRLKMLWSRVSGERPRSEPRMRLMLAMARRRSSATRSVGVEARREVCTSARADDAFFKAS